MDDLDEGLKKILLAGIGAAAATGEKAQKLFNDLAEKGAEAVNQNRDLNEKFQKKAAEAASAARGACQKMTETQRTRREVAQTLAGMSDAELKQLKEALDGLGFRKAECKDGKAGEHGEQPADEKAAEAKAEDAGTEPEAAKSEVETAEPEAETAGPEAETAGSEAETAEPEAETADAAAETSTESTAGSAEGSEGKTPAESETKS